MDLRCKKLRWPPNPNSPRKCLRSGSILIALRTLSIIRTKSIIHIPMKKLLALVLMAAFAAFTTLNVQADDKEKAPPAEKNKAEKSKAGHLPLRGKVVSVDKAANSIKVGEHVYYVVGTTKLTKTGKTATLDDVTVGEMIGGAYKDNGGKLELLSLNIGPAPEKKPKGEK